MIHPKNLFKLFVKAGKAWADDYAPSMGAAISYYTVFSLGQIVAQLGGLIGQQGATMVQGLVAAASDTDKGLVAGIISVFVLLVGATTVFAELQSALDRIWHVPEAKKPQGIWAILRARLLSFGLILGVVFMLMVSLSVSAALAALSTWTGDLMPGSAALLEVLNLVVSLGVATVLFAMIYKFMPTTKIGWRDVWVGAFTTSVLFVIGKYLIGLYLGKSDMTESFAAAGSLVVLLAWVYYAAQIFLLGAEFTKVYADQHGSRSADKAMTATEQTAAAGGVPKDTKGDTKGESKGRRLVPEPIMVKDHPEPSPVIRTADVGMHAAMSKLFSEVMAVVLLSIATAFVSKKRKGIERKLKFRTR
jgi:membrane protein